MRTLTTRTIAVLTTVAVAALAPISLAAGRSHPQAHAAASSVRVTGGEFFFRLSKKSVPRTGRVTFSFRNAGHMLHDFRIDGHQTSLTKPGRTARLAVTFRKPGRYHYLCTVPGHAAAGMKGIFTVR